MRHKLHTGARADFAVKTFSPIQSVDCIRTRASKDDITGQNNGYLTGANQTGVRVLYLCKERMSLNLF